MNKNTVLNWLIYNKYNSLIMSFDKDFDKVDL